MLSPWYDVIIPGNQLATLRQVDYIRPLLPSCFIHQPHMRMNRPAESEFIALSHDCFLPARLTLGNNSQGTVLTSRNDVTLAFGDNSSWLGLTYILDTLLYFLSTVPQPALISQGLQSVWSTNMGSSITLPWTKRPNLGQRRYGGRHMTIGPTCPTP